MEKEKLIKVLELHKKWLKGEENGVRANLYNADLRYADLSNANLYNADLRYADLSNANLYNAKLRYADLRYADLSNANLLNVDLSNANLLNVDLRYADLRYADLSNANLYNANLSGANLSGAILSGAILSGADLKGAKNIPFVRLSCPEYGSFIAWKKLNEGKIAKLLIPEEAKRSSATSNKCRASEAVVLSIENSDGTPCESGFSQRDRNFKYEVGKHLKVDNFDNNRWEECAPGIHFFINKQEAIEYN